MLLNIGESKPETTHGISKYPLNEDSKVSSKKIGPNKVGQPYKDSKI